MTSKCKNFIRQVSGILDRARSVTNPGLRLRALKKARELTEKAIDSAKTGKDIKAIDKLIDRISTKE